MFGYITSHPAELKLKDYDCYHGFYCGLCRSLKNGYGPAGQATLSYDMTFLGLLLSGLYEPATGEKQIICPLHPSRKQLVYSNTYIDYAADMNLLLSYYDLLDDWQDEKKASAKLKAGLLKKKAASVKAKYPRQAAAVEHYVAELGRVESGSTGAAELDTVAGLTGHMLGEIFCVEEDVWAPYLRRLGFYLGKFIYLLDAYEDLPEDAAKGRYNPWLSKGSSRPALKDEAQQILTLMMSEGSLAFEHLPVIKYGDILRNILYAGVWLRFEKVCRDDEAEEEKAHGV